MLDGCVRDVAELAVLPVGILARGRLPMPPEKRMLGQTDVPVRVQDIWIRPGDWLYADEDGVVLGAAPLV